MGPKPGQEQGRAALDIDSVAAGRGQVELELVPGKAVPCAADHP